MCKEKIQSILNDRKRLQRTMGLVLILGGVILIIATLVMGLLRQRLSSRKIIYLIIGLGLLFVGLICRFWSKDTTLRIKSAFSKIVRSFTVKAWDGNTLFRNLLVPFSALFFYCATFLCTSSLVGLMGVNFHFFTIFSLLMTSLVIVSYIMFAIAQKKKKGSFRANSFIPRFPFGDLILLLLPLTPILQYILVNQDILSIKDSLILVLFFMLFCGIYVIVIPYGFQVIGSKQVLMSLGLAFVSMIAFMPMLSDHYSWLESGNFWIQLLFFIGIFLATFLLSRFRDKWILYVPIIIFFFFNSAYQIYANLGARERSVDTYANNKLLQMVEGRVPQTFPDIYLLVYDSYIPNETLLLNGIDNSLQEQYLTDLGFTLYPHTYTIADNTVASMSRVFTVSLSYYGQERRGISGNGVVQNLFRSLGYRTYGIFPTSYMFTGVGSSYDVSFPNKATQSYIQLGAAIFMGEFRFDLNFGDPTHQQYEQIKLSEIQTIPKQKVFLYTHSDLPGHAQDSGRCLSDEIDLYKQRLDQANIEMQWDLSWILQYDPDAIIIIAGDHGPTLTKDCSATLLDYPASDISRLDLQDRYAAFLAIKWPTNDFSAYDDITILQDLFPAIFAYMYQDPNLLDSRIPPVTVPEFEIAGISINNGIIEGGNYNGELLFLSQEQ
jgi:hypothetical protein